MLDDLVGATDTAGMSSGLELTAARILAECLTSDKALEHTATLDRRKRLGEPPLGSDLDYDHS